MWFKGRKHFKLKLGGVKGFRLIGMDRFRASFFDPNTNNPIINIIRFKRILIRITQLKL